jgi:hypothetical protein
MFFVDDVHMYIYIGIELFLSWLTLSVSQMLMVQKTEELLK